MEASDISGGGGSVLVFVCMDGGKLCSEHFKIPNCHFIVKYWTIRLLLPLLNVSCTTHTTLWKSHTESSKKQLHQRY